ncbi:MAG: hypothetical protein U0793_01550 [Gemmataceae bacterium]
MSTRLIALFLFPAAVLCGGCSDQPVPKIDLAEAAARGLVNVSGAGNGLETIKVSLDSTTDLPLEVTIGPGVLFQAGSDRTQNMVTREEKKVALRGRGHTETVVIEAACVNMHKDMPSPSKTFALGKTPAADNLKKLVSYPAFRKQRFRVQQFAIWTITDNPATRERYMGLGPFIATLPSDDEMRAIRALFLEAGIPTAEYGALR